MARNNYYSREALLVVTDGRAQARRGDRNTAGNNTQHEAEFFKPHVRSDSCASESSASTSTTANSTTSTSLSSTSCRRVLLSPPRSSSSEIRSRFLNRLGFSKQPRAPPAACKKQVQVSPAILHGKENTLEEDLKGDHGRKMKNQNKSTSRRRARSVSFDDTVKVHPIPKHSEYSNRIRDQLWTDPSIQQHNVARNCMEFAAEGWNWQQVEEEMVVCPNGEKVHPVHFIPQMNLSWRFCAFRAMHQNQN